MCKHAVRKITKPIAKLVKHVTSPVIKILGGGDSAPSGGTTQTIVEKAAPAAPVVQQETDPGAQSVAESSAMNDTNADVQDDTNIQNKKKGKRSLRIKRISNTNGGNALNI